jgi:hypothetical protein
MKGSGARLSAHLYRAGNVDPISQNGSEPTPHASLHRPLPMSQIRLLPEGARPQLDAAVIIEVTSADGKRPRKIDPGI